MGPKFLYSWNQHKLLNYLHISNYENFDNTKKLSGLPFPEYSLVMEQISSWIFIFKNHSKENLRKSLELKNIWIKNDLMTTDYCDMSGIGGLGWIFLLMTRDT